MALVKPRRPFRLIFTASPKGKPHSGIRCGAVLMGGGRESPAAKKQFARTVFCALRIAGLFDSSSQQIQNKTPVTGYVTGGLFWSR